MAEKSGLPFASRGTGFDALGDPLAASVERGVVPATFTVTVRVSFALFGPPTVRVYVVVRAGVSF